MDTPDAPLPMAKALHQPAYLRPLMSFVPWVALWSAVLVYHSGFHRAFFDPKALAVVAGALIAAGLVAFQSIQSPNRASPEFSQPFARLLVAMVAWIVLGNAVHSGGTGGPMASPDYVPVAAVMAVVVAWKSGLPASKFIPPTAILAVMVAAIGIAQFLGRDPLGYLAPWLGRNESLGLAISTFGNPNYGALTLAPLAAFLAGLALAPGSWSGLSPICRSANATVALALMAYVAATQSRTAALALLAAIFAIAALNFTGLRFTAAIVPNSRNRWLPVGIATLAVFLTVVSGTWNKAEDVNRAARSQPSRGPLTYRLALWQDTWALALRNPLFGVGPGALADALSREGSQTLKAMPGRGFANERFDLAHQDWAQFAAARGLPFFAMVATFWLWLGSRLWRGAVQRFSPATGDTSLPDRGLAFAAVPAFVCASVLSVADFPFHFPPSALMIGLLLALPWIGRVPPPHPSTTAPSPRHGDTGLASLWRFAGPAIMLAFGAGLLWRPVLTDAPASLSLGAARAALARNSPAEAMELASQSLRYGADAGLAGQIIVAAARQMGDRHQALKAAQAWTAARPFDADGWNTLGAARAESQQYDEAIAAWKKAIDLSPANAAAALNIALLFHALDQPHRAVPYFEKVRDIHPDLFQQQREAYEQALRESATRNGSSATSP